MVFSIAELREDMIPYSHCQPVSAHGGDQPNVIPQVAKIWWYFRASAADASSKLFERARQLAQGVALMTATT
jgi:aminobenzoyl-glutamate utilization protein B